MFWIRERELLKELADEVDELNGRPTSSDRCLKAFGQYREAPTDGTRQALREAYEAVPEHLRHYLGDMDSKDSAIREAIYGPGHWRRGSWGSGRAAKATSRPTSGPALVFDLYGTLVDLAPLQTRIEEASPARGQEIATLWRQKQLEYTLRLVAMEEYQDFERIAWRALDNALDATGVKLSQEEKRTVLGQHDDLSLFPDVAPALKRFRAAGFTMIVVSNGTPRMIEWIFHRTGLRAYFDEYVSADEVGAYMPSPQVYRHVARQLDRDVRDVHFISSNASHVDGAQSAGMLSSWVVRSRGGWDILGDFPSAQVHTIGNLADTLIPAWSGR